MASTSRTFWLTAAAVLAAAGGALIGAAGLGPEPAAAAPRADACAGRTDVLGVDRVIEIDTAEGPQFGLQQYKQFDILQPGEVILTFDDGPLRPYTTPVLKALEAHCTRATFFQVGKMAIADPEMVRDIERRGHTVGSHTWSHRNLRSMAPALAKGELELGVSAVSKALGHPIAPFFRFPYLADSRAMIAHAKSRGIGMFSIEVDAVDFRTRDPGTVHRRVMGDLKRAGKGIILFHDIQPSTAGALKGLLDDLKAKGYRVVHMVPKGQVKTLPDYDAIAEREMGKKAVASAAQPLARRSVVWPVQAGMAAAEPQPAAAERGPAAGPGTGTRQRTAAPAAAGEVLPWLAKPAQTPTATPPPATTPGPTARTPTAQPASQPMPAATPASAPPPARPPRPTWRTDETEPWQLRIFRN